MSRSYSCDAISLWKLENLFYDHGCFLNCFGFVSFSCVTAARFCSHRKSASWSHGSAGNELICHLVPSMYLHSNSFWKMLDFLHNLCSEVIEWGSLWLSVVTYLHSNLLFALLFLVNMVFLNVANSVGLSKLAVFHGLHFVFRLHSNDTLSPILCEGSEAWRFLT